jgi:hypothetical protein
VESFCTQVLHILRSLAVLTGQLLLLIILLKIEANPLLQKAHNPGHLEHPYLPAGTCDLRFALKALKLSSLLIDSVNVPEGFIYVFPSRRRTMSTCVHMHPIMKNFKKCYFKVSEKFKECKHVYPIVTLIYVDFGIKEPYVTYT